MSRRVLYLVFVCSLIDDLLCLSVSENMFEHLVKDVLELKRLKTEQDKRIEEQSKLIKEQGKMMEEQSKIIEEQGKMIKEQSTMIKEQSKIIEEQCKMFEKQSKRIEKHDQRIEMQDVKIEELETQLTDKPVKDKRRKQIFFNTLNSDKPTQLLPGLTDVRLRMKTSLKILMSLPNAQQPVPAFSASLWTHIFNLGSNQAITFDNVFTNIGNVYSPHSGAFTAPHNGTYYFVAVVMAHSGQYLETEICLNGRTLVYIYSRDNFYEQGTNSIVLTLNQGDMVWVRHLQNEGSNVYGENWSTFSGFQIG